MPATRRTSLWSCARFVLSVGSGALGSAAAAAQLEVVDEVVEMRPGQIELARRFRDVPVVLFERLEHVAALELPRGLLQREDLGLVARCIREDVVLVQRCRALSMG